MKKRRYVIMFLCSLLSAPVLAQSQDTVGHQTILNEVHISADKIPSQVNAAAPTQVLTLEKLDQIGATQVADALNQMAGVTIKDYGGVGGVKTVSARGLGSQFSTLTIDGVAVTDCQNGQIDLSRYLIGNTAYVALYQGHRDDLFQTARSFAAGSVVDIHSVRPTANTAKLSMEGGSFGYMAPTLQVDRRLSQKVAASIWANYTRSEGDYPFTIYYTSSRQDSSSVERRKHSDMWMATATANIFAKVGWGELTGKLHYNKAFHNLPGPATYYNIKSSEHTEDDAYFAQARYVVSSRNHRLRWQVVGKAFGSDCVYADSAAGGTLNSVIHNEYHQQEYYLSSTLRYHLLHHLTVSAATDEALARLQTNLSHDNRVARLSGQNVVAMGYDRQRFAVSANLLATLMKDINADAEKETSYEKVSPYVSASGVVVERGDSTRMHRLRVRYFYKENYRVPTFNELYYFTMTRELKPEKALQHNLGLSYHCWRQAEIGGTQSDMTLDVTADAYYNRVMDKLVAIPTQNLFLWSMMNLGRVEIKGLDLSAQANVPMGRHQLSVSGNYTYQDARDMTDPTDKTYDQQIPYIPRHSGGAILSWSNPWVDCSYSVVLVGDRYRLGQNTAENLVEGYADQSIGAGRKFALKHGQVELRVSVMNLFDVQYEVVKSYPMMGRNFRIKIEYTI